MNYLQVSIFFRTFALNFDNKPNQISKLFTIMKTKITVIILFATVLTACFGGGSGSGSQSTDSQEIIAQIQEVNKLLGQLERKADKVLTPNTSVKDMKELSDICEQLDFDYDPMQLEPEVADQCKALQLRIDSVKRSINSRIETLSRSQLVQLLDIQDEVLEQPQACPVYLERGDKLFYAVDAEKTVDVRIYNTDTHQLLKTYTAKRSVLDSMDIRNKGIYLIHITPKMHQYVDVRIGYQPGSVDRLMNVKQVETKEVEARKGDFLAYSKPGIAMKNLFEEPRKFTLRGQLKAAFSGSSRAIVALQVPKGATDVLYSLRISTNEPDRASDGKFHDNMQTSYKRVKMLGLPVYESQRGAGIISTLLGENQPLREEDAYINMYVFYDSKYAKQFQDGKSAANLPYNVDYSTLGTQSCNGRIPSKGRSTIYLAFENERMRYNNYVWLEAVSAVPHTEYYKTEYKVK